MKNHIKYIDMARGFAICGIAYSHFISIVSISKPDLSTSLGIRFFSVFHVPIFFIIRGQVLAYHGELKLTREFVLKRVKSIMLPYFAFSLLNIIYAYIDMTIHNIPNVIIEYKRNMIHTLTFYGISVLWFLPMMFLGELWFVLLKSNAAKSAAAKVICLLMIGTYMVSPYLEVKPEGCIWMQSMGLLILNYILVVLFRSFLALFYIWIGYQTLHFFQKLKEQKKKEIISTATFLGTGSILLPYVRTIEIHYLKLGGNRGLLSFVCTICFSFGFLLLFQIIENRSIKWLSFLGVNSLWIMCSHKDFGIPNWCMQVGNFFVSVSPRAKNYVFWIAAFGALLLIESGISLLCNRFVILCKRKKGKASG